MGSYATLLILHITLILRRDKYDINMRTKLLLIFTLCIAHFTKAQTLVFTYDPAGNQVQRELVILPVNSLLSTNSTEETEQEEETLLPKSNSINDNSTEIELYPNPVVDILNVEWQSNLQITEIMLFDSTGKMLQLKKIYEGATRETFNLSSYSPGMYYVRLFDSFQQSKSYKIIKK